MSLSRKTMEHPVLILIVFALLGLLGIFTYSKIAMALFPETENPYLSISVSYPNAGPESVEKTITKSIESAVISVNGLKGLTSTSNEGSSNVSLEFEYGTDLDVAINDIRDKLDRVKRGLPENAGTPSIFRFNTNSSSVMRILIRGNRSPDDLKQIAENSIISILEQADGVGQASVNGGRSKQVNVQLDANRLQAYGLTIPSVTSALSRQNLELGGGKVQQGTKNYIVRTTGEYTSLEEIKDTVITNVKGYSVKVSDVADVFLGYAEVSQESFINGQKGVYISITKQSGANSVNVANAVYKKIDQVKHILPPDVSLEIIQDETEAIRETIDILVESLLQGLFLAIIILWIFLQNFKSTIIIGISIPLSMIITLFAMSMFNITLNMMTLTGLILGLGMVVDASIVMIENIYAYRQRGSRPKVAAILGSQEMMMSVISGNLTTICVFLPFIFFIDDLEILGQMFQGIIFTIVIALISSLLVAMFLVPVLAGKFLPLSNRKEKPVTNRVLIVIYAFFQKIIDAISNAYSKLLKKSLNRRAFTLIVSIGILLVSIALIPTMKFNMMPMGREDSVTLNVTLPVGTTFEETKKVVMGMQHYVDTELKGVKNVTTSIGRGRNSGTNTGSIQITLPETEKQIDSSQVMQQKLRKHFDEFPQASLSFRAGMRGSMFGSDIDIVLRSDDLESTLDIADKIAQVIKDNSECSEPTISMERGLPQVEIVIDRDKAYDFGVDISTVAREINYAINGTNACVYRNNGKDYNVEVSYKPEDRKTIDDLETIYVRGTNGMVSVANFASLKKGLGPVTIRRENQTRIVHITAGILSDTNANIIEQQIKNEVTKNYIIPESVAVSFEGSWQETVNQRNLFLKIIAMAVILVFGVMAATYESFKAPLINLATIPFLIIGVIFLYKIIGQPLSIISLVGIVMLVGIVVNNGIILVDYTNLLVGRGIELKEACYLSGKSRFRPVMMTTLTTILGMLPMCFTTGGQAMLVQPIALAVVGGLISSTFVTLLVIPVLYSFVMKSRTKQKQLIKINYES